MAPKHTKPTKNRRRKKRRTEDFSSDSDSSDSDSGTQSPTEQLPKDVPSETAPKESININDIDMVSDSEANEKAPENNHIPADTQEKLASIKFTSTGKESLAESKETVLRDRKELDSEFLAYMATTFADELDELRKKPDFTEKSLVILAKALQSGSNMFDSESLGALLN